MITAAVIIIGDEILSGRTQDANLNYIALGLRSCGIELKECRVVSDKEDAIIEAVQALSKRNTYVFTTVGIGSTHDDITSSSVAMAFNKNLVVHDEALKLLESYYGDNINNARRRMALAADGAILHERMVFQIENVFIMAGIPRVMREMFDSLLPKLQHGEPILSISLKANGLENDLADELADIQNSFSDVIIGSYPFYEENNKGTCLVATANSESRLKDVEKQLQALIDSKY